MKEVIYMLDTNILLKWAVSFTSSFADKSLGRIKNFCEKNHNRIYIPDLVWTEFLSVMLHKDIDVEGDYNETRSRFHGRQSLVQQIEFKIRSSENIIFNWVPEHYSFTDAQALLQDRNLIDRKTFQWMKRSAENRKKYIHMDRLSAKLLDGMDSLLLIYLNELALQEENQDSQVVLYTADYPLYRILGRIKEINSTQKNPKTGKIEDGWFAPNTRSICALFGKLKCRKCWADNFASILYNKNMQCVLGHRLKI